MTIDTAALRAKLEAEHPRWSHENVHRECGDYPCSVQLLLDALDAERERADAAERELGLHKLNDVGLCPACYDAGYEHGTEAAEARAALEAESRRGDGLKVVTTQIRATALEMAQQWLAKAVQTASLVEAVDMEWATLLVQRVQAEAAIAQAYAALGSVEP
ncbi:MAG: hypothetical protein H0U59_10990 [Gemmatimonadaceae bacterium]|nr:hypothetical protein [Gemmatimonadaceae bacterium]